MQHIGGDYIQNIKFVLQKLWQQYPHSTPLVYKPPAMGYRLLCLQKIHFK